MSTEPYVMSSVLSKMLEVALAARSKDESRPALTGVQFLFEPGYLRLAAIDGYMLSLVETCYEHELIGTALAPGDELQRLVKRWAKVRLPLALAFDDRMLGFSQWYKTGTYPLIALGQVLNSDGQVARFPDWQAILLNALKLPYQVTFEAWDLVDRVTVFKGGKSHEGQAAALRFGPKGAAVEMPPLAAGDGRIGINLSLLAAALRPFQPLSPTLTFRWGAPLKPVLFEYESAEWRSVTLIMPMQITR